MGAISCSVERRHVLRQIAARQQPAVHDRVQRLDPAVEHLRKPRDLADVPHGEAGLAQRPRRATGGDEFPPERGETLREFDKAGFVGDGEKRAGHDVGIG